ncbi:MAG: MarR family winged helix-turn-helix transcriptional regulator [Oscillospiraceae bacterium]
MQTTLAEIGMKLDRLFLFRRIEVNRSACDTGLFLGQLPLLKYIMTHPKCTQKQLADKLGLSAASIALSTKRLQSAGMIIKEVNSQNLRENMLSATPLGEKNIVLFRNVIDDCDKKMFAGFSSDELDMLLSFFDRLLCNMAGVDTLPDPKDMLALRETFLKNNGKL